jgi:hypothetical protein
LQTFEYPQVRGTARASTFVAGQVFLDAVNGLPSAEEELIPSRMQHGI